MDKEELPLTRDDFPDRESWLRHCYEGGIDLALEAGDDFEGLVGTGPYGHRLSSIYGQTQPGYLRTWEGRPVSNSLRWRQFTKGYEAIAFANCMGLVLDSTLDITWTLQGISADLRVAHYQGLFLDALRRWFERHGERATFYWVLERGARRGLHTHLALNVPRSMAAEFYDYARATLARIVGMPLYHLGRERAFLFQPRGGRDIIRQWKRFAYVMKGLDNTLMWPDRNNPAASPQVRNWGFIPFKNQGEIAVKRMGVSRFLDDASRRRWSAANNFPSMSIGSEGPALDDRYIAWFHDNHDQIARPADA